MTDKDLYKAPYNLLAPTYYHSTPHISRCTGWSRSNYPPNVLAILKYLRLSNLLT